MTTFSEKLTLAKAATIITPGEADATGGCYFDEMMGLWIRQDADGGGIMPFAWQMDLSWDADQPGDLDEIRQLFKELGRTADIEAYDQQAGSYMGD